MTASSANDDYTYRNQVNAAIDQSNRVSSLPMPTPHPDGCGAALTDQDVAGQNKLTVAALNAEALGLGITAVLGGAHTFLWAKNCRPMFSIFQYHPFCKGREEEGGQLP